MTPVISMWSVLMILYDPTLLIIPLSDVDFWVKLLLVEQKLGVSWSHEVLDVGSLR